MIFETLPGAPMSLIYRSPKVLLELTKYFVEHTYPFYRRHFKYCYGGYAVKNKLVVAYYGLYQYDYMDGPFFELFLHIDGFREYSTKFCILTESSNSLIMVETNTRYIELNKHNLLNRI